MQGYNPLRNDEKKQKKWGRLFATLVCGFLYKGLDKPVK